MSLGIVLWRVKDFLLAGRDKTVWIAVDSGMIQTAAEELWGVVVIVVATG